MSTNSNYVDLPVISGEVNGPKPFDWDVWYGRVGGRTISIEEADRLMALIKEQEMRFDSPVSPQKRSKQTPLANSQWVKSLAIELGSHAVGICAVEEADVYQGRQVNEQFAIVMGMKMRYESFVTVPSEDAAIECLRIYYDLGEVVINLADTLRKEGVACKIEHPIGDSSVMHVPLALKAGFGELGRHGSIIHPTMGPLFRLGCILTNLPLETDSPIDAGIGAFCDKCQACRIFCPADAIPDKRSPSAGPDPIGNDRYQVDTGKCFPYFAKRNYCSACLAVCAYQHKKWAILTNGMPGPFPTVPFGDIPPAADPAEQPGIHTYNRIRREKPSPFHRKR